MSPTKHMGTHLQAALDNKVVVTSVTKLAADQIKDVTLVEGTVTSQIDTQPHTTPKGSKPAAPTGTRKASPKKKKGKKGLTIPLTGTTTNPKPHTTIPGSQVPHLDTTTPIQCIVGRTDIFTTAPVPAAPTPNALPAPTPQGFTLLAQLEEHAA
jgi:hypothetical protein